VAREPQGPPLPPGAVPCSPTESAGTYEAPGSPPGGSLVSAEGTYTKLPAIGREMSSHWHRPIVLRLSCGLLLLLALAFAATAYYFMGSHTQLQQQSQRLQQRAQLMRQEREHLRQHARELQHHAERSRQQRRQLEQEKRRLQQQVQRLQREGEKLQREAEKWRREAEKWQRDGERSQQQREQLEQELTAGCMTSCSSCWSEARMPHSTSERPEEHAGDANHTRSGAGKGRPPSRRSEGFYGAITGQEAHQLPEMYGKVREKTIWSYWYDPEDCPSSKHCVLPTVIQLCAESIQRNRGSFEYRIVHRDEVDKYVNRMELPLRWEALQPAQQKDSLMNALLARYGGVAMDISTVLLRPLDRHWDEMVAFGAAFRGYVYRLNGRPWRHAEVAVVWFLMARREGLFATAVRSQVIGMGDRRDTSAYRHRYLALGDQTLLPILSMFNYSLPKCYDDPTVDVDPSSKLHQFEDQNPRWCPEHEQRPWYEGLTGPPRNDTKLFLEDPRDGLLGACLLAPVPCSRKTWPWAAACLRETVQACA